MTTQEMHIEIDLELQPFADDRLQHVVLSWDHESRPLSIGTASNETIELEYKGGTLYDLGTNIAEALNNISTSLKFSDNTALCNGALSSMIIFGFAPFFKNISIICVS